MKFIPAWIGVCSMVGIFGLRAAEAQAPVNPLALAEKVLAKGLAEIDLGLYPGSLLVQGMAELALVSPDKSLLPRAVELGGKFATKELKGRGSFISYEVGGSGAAYLRFRGAADSLGAQVADGAKRMVAQQKRSGEKLLVPGWAVAEKDQVFIDIAFAVTPFLLYAGLAEHRDDYVDLAVFETLELFRILRDPRTGLLHQGRGFQGLGVVSEDNWSRGNGWGVVGLAALIRDLPATHPRRPEVESLAKEFFLAVLRHQNKDGLWHQEVTDPTSYVETSGSGLLLYGLGIALERGVLDRRYAADLLKGLGGLTAYIAADGSVSHACIGCRCPGQGTKDDYKQRLWAYNDPHAFGAVVLAYAQAAKLGLREITPALKPGCFAAREDAPGKPRTYVRYNPDGGQNVGWENDRIAFRVYGPSVRNRVGSGIDVWAKSVEFPIIDKWYRLNAAGFEYHVERGEGCDFYDVGNSRGCGGLAVWRNDRPFVSQTYATQRIVRNEPGDIEFVLTFDPWDAGGIQVSEERRVRMVLGTNLFQVGSTLKTAGDADLTAALGLTTAGHAAVKRAAASGTLSCWEQLKPDHGALGTAVIVEPANCAGFAQSGKDEFVLVKVKSNQPFRYYIGAGWERSPRFKTAARWDDYVARESGWAQLNVLYSRPAATK